MLAPQALDFAAFVNFLKKNGHNATILWRKDLPQFCQWDISGSVWNMTPWPWLRTGPGLASDGNPQFDLTHLDQTYFDRLRARVLTLQSNNIYAIVQLFDGLGITANRCSTDGYPFSRGNNINGVSDDGANSSMTMSVANAITNVQDAYVLKVIDTLHDLPNVLWEISEEAPDNSTWWQGHMISLIHSYELTTYGVQHPVGYPTLNVSGANDTQLYNSNADWVSPVARFFPASSCGSGTPPCKVNINDSDHSLYYTSFTNSDGTLQNATLRAYLWENLTGGAGGLLFMDPYLVLWQGSPLRNMCSNALYGICTGAVDPKYGSFRANMGYALAYVNTKLDLVKMTPQSNLTSTGFCLADNTPVGAEYLIYAPNGGTFTVNLSATVSTLNVEWFDPSTGTTTAGGTINGGSTTSFTSPFKNDTVLYLVDSAGHN